MRGIITRARDALKPLFFGEWKQIESDATGSPSSWIIQPVRDQSMGQITPSNYETQIGANVGPVHASLSLIANQVGDATLRVYRPKRKNAKSVLYYTRTREIPRAKKQKLLDKAAPGSVLSLSDDAEEIVGGHRLIDLLQRVNPDSDIFQLQHITTGYLGLIGNEYWILLKDGMGIPQHIVSAPGEFMRAKQGPDGWISGYVYKRGQTTKEFASDEVVHIKAPAPGAAFQIYGRGDLMGAAYDFNLLQNMYQFEQALLGNDAIPGTVLSVPGSLSQDQRDALLAMFEQRHGGASKAARPIVGEGGMKVEHLSYSPKDMMVTSSRKFANEQIYGNFRAPVAMLTGQTSTRAALESSLAQIMMFAVKPYLALIQQALNAQLVPLYKDPIYVEYDEVVPEDKEFQLEEDTKLLEAAAVSGNEVRSRRGMDDMPGLEVPYQSLNKIPVGTEIDRSSPAVIEDMVEQAYAKAKQRYRGNG